MRHDKLVALFLFFTAFSLAPVARAEETAIVAEGKVNVRGKPSFAGEVITQLQRGDKVTVLERLTIDKPKTNEPAQWARIRLPENTPVWVFAPFVKEGKVAVTRLNLRAGAGENHDVIGRLGRGDEVKVIRTVVEWMEIEAPKDAYAFVDLGLLRFEGGTNAAPAAATVASATPNLPQETPAARAVPQPEAAPTEIKSPPAAVATAQETRETGTQKATPPAQPTETAATETKPATEAPGSPTAVAEETAKPAETPGQPEAPSPALASPGRTEPLPRVADPLPPKRAEPLPKRVVRREGIVRPTKSIQAPTWYELVHPETGKTINYLYDAKLTEKLGLKLKDYRGRKVVVTGEELIEARWPNTPIMDLESLDVLP